MKFASLQKNILNSKRFSQAITFWVAILVGLCLVFVGGYVAKDWYLNLGSKLTCFGPLHFFPPADYFPFGVDNPICIQTTDSAEKVANFYKEHGFICDGACEYDQTMDFGFFQIDVYKGLLIDYQSTPIRISLIEEYDVSTFSR